MKAIATCPECKKQVETDCSRCIERGDSCHPCKDGEVDVVEVDWKICPETEKDLERIETK